ncbi:Peptidase A24B, FlaK domain-containing protein [Methanocaldococcus villosus KIN24-T80]|uniref:Peptidase A24B, FlaK domain-containing protein n=1 Tax=Methanocaldococcus villosus KIN24-T80 TaxID=1069083 RepID=N6V0I0_9EURY|nr:preflagellin peptidase FlaK [Methanocaldococcus villosus]ENN95828.1 Peptidase A24B, FlaK domain-containing protein [Methanocaldococcus villosus KIN24-T80]
MINYAFGLLCILIALYCDIKSREINEYIWITMIIFGLMYHIYLTFVTGNLIYITQSILGIVICFFLGYFMFLLGVGGGDGKLLIGLGALVPKYNIPISSPLGYLLSHPYLPTFPIFVLINAIFLIILIPIIVFLKNISKYKPKNIKEFFMMFIAEKHKFSDIKDKNFVVLGKDGNINIIKNVEKKEEYGDDDIVWASPEIPFVVPIFFSYILTPFIGDLIFKIIFNILA